MAIRYRSALEPELAAATGAAIGKAEARKKQQEIDWQRESEIRANQLKMQLQEQEIQRQFFNEQRREQIAIDRELRAHEWETDKMVLASQADFAKQEQVRQKAYDEFLSQQKMIDDNTNLSDMDKWNIKVQSAQKVEKYNFSEANEILGKESTIEQGRKQSEAAEVRNEVAAYLGRDVANLLPLSQGVEMMNREKARLGEASAAAVPAATAYGVENLPTEGIPAANVPAVITDEDYNKLPSGTEFMDEEGKKWRKP